MAKQVMMSKPAGGGLKSAPSIGNYKGVMLCNRPFAGVQKAANKGKSSGGKGVTGAFLAGTPGGAIGLNPAKRVMPHARPKKKTTAISKHKKWLAEMQTEKRKLEDELMADEGKKAERRQKFADRERKMRDAVRNQRTEPVESKSAGRSLPAADAYPEDDALDQMLSDAQKKKVKQRNKPAWAYAEGGKEKEEEEMEEEELENLLKFSTELDFDQYIEDFEVRSALEQLKKRMEELTPREGEDDDARLQRALKSKELSSNILASAGMKALRGLSAEALEEWDFANMLGGGEKNQEEDDDSRSVALSILEENKGMRGIHSERSIMAMKRKAERAGSKLAGIDEGPIEEPEYRAPKIASTKEDDRFAHKKQASRMPYIHRNPAV